MRSMSNEEYADEVQSALQELESAAGRFYRIGRCRAGYWPIIGVIDHARDMVTAAERRDEEPPASEDYDR